MKVLGGAWGSDGPCSRKGRRRQTFSDEEGDQGHGSRVHVRFLNSLPRWIFHGRLFTARFLQVMLVHAVLAKSQIQLPYHTCERFLLCDSRCIWLSSSADALVTRTTLAKSSMHDETHANEDEKS